MLKFRDFPAADAQDPPGPLDLIELLTDTLATGVPAMNGVSVEWLIDRFDRPERGQ